MIDVLKGIDNLLVIIAGLLMLLVIGVVPFLGGIYFSLRDLSRFFREQSHENRDQKPDTVNERTEDHSQDVISK